jgi:hypothetical protein
MDSVNVKALQICAQKACAAAGFTWASGSAIDALAHVLERCMFQECILVSGAELL